MCYETFDDDNFLEKGQPILSCHVEVRGWYYVQTEVWAQSEQ
jgi:hypothetical protein